MRLRNLPRIPASEITDEAVYRDRRRLLGMLAASPLLGLSGCAEAEPPPPPSTRTTRAQARAGFSTSEEPTRYEDITTYNNFYEFGSSKTIWSAASKLKLRPWTVAIGGAVEKPQEIAIDDLLARVPLEERVYRLRCVEAWSMVVPWSGFQLSHLLKLAQPLSSARYVRFTTAEQPDVMRGLRASWYPWPYQEGLTMEEAGHELAFMATGIYGKPLPPQNGAPLRLVVPWKYGFKSIKSVVAIDFVEQRPTTFWEAIAANEYGFWANVNPEVPHPRWSQASERVLGTKEEVPTQLFNGYAEEVAGLYAGLDAQSERLFM